MGLKSVSRGGWVAVGASALAVASGSAFAGEQFANRVELGASVPAPGTAVATARPLVALATKNVRDMRNLKVTIDGVDIAYREAGHNESFAIESAIGDMIHFNGGALPRCLA